MQLIIAHQPTEASIDSGPVLATRRPRETRPSFYRASVYIMGWFTGENRSGSRTRAGHRLFEPARKKTRKIGPRSV
jgi:hypothetical protein